MKKNITIDFITLSTIFFSCANSEFGKREVTKEIVYIFQK